jgi:hypothetical protein
MCCGRWRAEIESTTRRCGNGIKPMSIHHPDLAANL